MQLVTAIIKPFQLDSVKEALQELGLSGMTVVDAQGHGRQRGQTAVYRGSEYTVDFVPKVKIEIVVDDAKLATIIDTIVKAAQTGQVGDGKIFVSDLTDAVRIRTAETGVSAL